MNDKTHTAAQPMAGNDALAKILEDGQVPDDPREIEKMLGFDSNSKDSTKADAAGADGSGNASVVDVDPSDEAAAKAAADKVVADAAAAAAAKPTTDSKTGDTPAAGAAATGAADPEKDATGVATADGKGVIPYAVLKAARAEATKLREQLAGVTAAQKQNLKEAGVVDLTKTADGKADELPMLDDKQIAELRKTYPKQLVDSIVMQQTAIKKLGAVAETLQGALRQRDANDNEVRAQLLQDDIDSVPGLATLQSEATTEDASADAVGRWEAAKALDGALRRHPDWESKTRLERFQHVAKTLGLDVGAGAKSNGGPPSGPAAKPTAGAGAPGKPAVPASISDIPGGAAPPASEMAGLENATVHDLEARMAKMTATQIAELLARTG